MSLKEIITDSKNILIAVAVIITTSLGAVNYFATADELYTLRDDFYQHKLYQRFDYLDRRVADLEYNFGCYSIELCSKSGMSPELFQSYRELKIERERLWRSLNNK